MTSEASWLRQPLLERPWPFHPLLAPLPPLLAFVHRNSTMADWTELVPIVAGTWAVEAVVLVALTAALRSLRSAAIVVSMATILFYAHTEIGWGEVPAWLGVSLLAVLLAIRPRRGDAMTTFANLLGVVAVGMLAYNVYGDETKVRRPQADPTRFDAIDGGGPIAVGGTARPDVYYLVFDAYASAAILESRFGYHSPLPDALRARGFSIADDAHSNYIQTALSFAATLNLDFLPRLLLNNRERYNDRRAIIDLCQDNRVVRTFRSAGYRIVEYPGEYTITHQRADERRHPWVYFTEFEYVLIRHTPIEDLTRPLGLPQSWVAHQVRRNHLRYVLDGLAAGDDDPGPTFTFAHLVAPHPPFVFEPDGSYRPERAPDAFADGSTWLDLARPFHESYPDGYVAQTRWLDAQLPAVIDGILAKSPDAVILIQGDHGSGAGLEWTSQAKSDVPERTGILMAARLPGGAELPRSVTPVNGFRIVLNAVFGSGLPLLPDRSWFSTWKAPYRFSDVTDEVRTPPGPQLPVGLEPAVTRETP